VPASAAAIIGACAGIALSTKPQFILPLLLCEVWMVGRRPVQATIFVPEWGGVAAIGAAYASLFALYPDMRSEFFGYYLPIFLRGYGAYDCSWWRIFYRPEHILVILGLALAAGSGRLRRQASFASVLALVMLGCDVAFVLQHKGWSYQAFPVFAVGGLWLAAVLPAQREVLGAAAAIATLSFCAFSAIPPPVTSDDVRLAALVRYVTASTRPDDSVLVLSTSVKGPYPLLVAADRRSGSRFGWLPLVPMLYRDVVGSPFPYRTWQTALPEERGLLERLAQDVAVRAPALILVDRHGGPGLAPNFDLEEWLSRSGFVAEAMSSYRSVGEVEGYDAWRRGNGQDVARQ
jgi:hypothetical protein